MAKDGAEQSLPSSDGQNIPAPAPAPAPHPTTAPATAPVTSNEVRAIFSILHRMCHGESTIGYGCMSCYMYNFFGNLKDPKPLDTLIRSCILRHLTGLYASENRKDSKKADYYIRYLLHLMVAEKTTGFLDERASVILQLCKVLRRMVCRKDSLYVLSLHSLKDLAEKANYVLLDTYKIFYPEWQILPIFDDLANRLLKGLHQCINSPSTKERMDSLISDFRDFKAFSRLYYHAIQEQKENQEDKGNAAPISSGRYKNDGRKLSIRYICFKLLHDIEFLLGTVQKSLVNGEEVQPEWSMYLAIFEELNFISRLCPHSRDKFWSVLKSAKLPLGALIVRFAKRRDGYDYQWLLEHNDVTDSDSRMHLAMLMIPGVKESTDAELMKKLVFWSQDLDTDQFRAFQHKSLKDPQVLQDCLCKSCEVIFNPNNPLFLAHPGDSPSFNVNPEFNPEPSHYEFVEFAGKVIALALIHKVRIGVALDGVFLTQLANSSMSYTSNKDLLVSFFAQGVASVFGVSFKELLSFKGLQYEDINQVLCGPSTSSVLSNSSGKRKKEIRIDPPLSHGKEVKKPERNFRNWQRGSMLGSGSFGEVYKGTADPNGFLFAAKKVPLEDTQKVSSIEHTVGSLRQLHHENIVEYFGTKKEEANLYIFHEFVSGGSLDKVHKELILDDARVSCYTQQILKGLKYLHEQNVMHGDIKCANILLNDKGVVQIADFGLAKVIDSENLHNSSRAIPAWSAPEVIDSTRQGGYGLEADIWSLGCTVLEMLTGEYPYCHLEPWTIWYRIGEGIPPDVPDFLSDTSRDFIEKCLQIDPKARPTAAQLLQHPFVKR